MDADGSQQEQGFGGGNFMVVKHDEEHEEHERRRHKKKGKRRESVKQESDELSSERQRKDWVGFHGSEPFVEASTPRTRKKKLRSASFRQNAAVMALPLTSPDAPPVLMNHHTMDDDGISADLGRLTDEEEFRGVPITSSEIEMDPTVIKRMKELLRRELPRKSVQMLAPKEKRRLQEHIEKLHKMQKKNLFSSQDEGELSDVPPEAPELNLTRSEDEDNEDWGLTDEEDFRGVPVRSSEIEMDPTVVKRMRELLRHQLPRKSVQMLAPRDKRHLQAHVEKLHKMQKDFRDREEAIAATLPAPVLLNPQPIEPEEDEMGLTDEEEFRGVPVKNSEEELDPTLVKRMRELLKRELPRKSVQMLAPKAKRHLQAHVEKMRKIQRKKLRNREDSTMTTSSRSSGSARRLRERSSPDTDFLFSDEENDDFDDTMQDLDRAIVARMQELLKRELPRKSVQTLAPRDKRHLQAHVEKLNRMQKTFGRLAGVNLGTHGVSTSTENLLAVLKSERDAALNLRLRGGPSFSSLDTHDEEPLRRRRKTKSPRRRSSKKESPTRHKKRSKSRKQVDEVSLQKKTTSRRTDDCSSITGEESDSSPPSRQDSRTSRGVLRTT